MSLSNRVFIAQHRARQVARDVTEQSFAPVACVTAGEMRRAGAYVPEHKRDYEDFDADTAPLEHSPAAPRERDTGQEAPPLGPDTAAASTPSVVAVRIDQFAGRRRVDVGRFYVAEVCGLTEERIAEIQPKEWEYPHDWRELGGVVFYREEGLRDFAWALACAGEFAAAKRLLAWLGPVKTVPAGSVGAASAPASESNEPANWAAKWERDHE